MKSTISGNRAVALCMAASAQFFGTGYLQAQDVANLAGTILAADRQAAVQSALVTIQGTGFSGASGEFGGYVLRGLPTGPVTVVVQALGYRLMSRTITLVAGSNTLDIALEIEPVVLGGVIVNTATRAPQRLVHAPAAISVVDPDLAADFSVTSQLPQVLESLPGVDVVQNGVTDYQVNTRGFNTTLNRRLLVLQDGRDLSLAFLGAQEWNSFSQPMEDFSRIELVRGPGSALYGANAFGGVLSLTTPSARAQQGTKITLAGGSLESFRGDLRHAGTSADGGFGYRFNVGLYTSDSWSRSRTNLGDLTNEYAAAVDIGDFDITAPVPGFELAALKGQTLSGPFGTPSSVTGDADPVQHILASARLDWYNDDGSIFTVEGGGTRVENEVGVTSTGRLQVGESYRPWGRVAWDSDRLNVMAWYSGRISDDQITMSTGIPIEESSHIAHVEAQTNQSVLNDQGRVVLGASARNIRIDSKGTLLPIAQDGRSDWEYSAYGQFEYDISPTLQLVTAARIDDSNIFDVQFSPKGSLVYRPSPNQSFRVTVNRAFLKPNTLELFVGIPAGPPADFSLIEAGLRLSALGPVLAGVPEGQLFTNSAAIPVLAIGNEELNPEHITSFEVGYKGQVSSKLFVTLDAYYSRISDLVTDILPGANPAFGPWVAPGAVPADFAPVVADAVSGILTDAGLGVVAAGLSNLEDGSTAVVFSLGNAGDAEVWGLEASVGVPIDTEWAVRANYSYFDYEIDSTTLIPGDVVRPNTAGHKGNVSVMYEGRSGFDFRAVYKLVDSFDWASGVWFGRVPDRQTLDVSLGHQISPRLRLRAVTTNLLDQKRYQVYGGSVIGRRVLAGVTWTR